MLTHLKINTEWKILFVLLIVQMSGLFSYKLGIAAFLATALVSLATVVFLIFEQTTQIALQETLHTLCTEPLLDHAQNTDSVAKNMSSE